MNEVDRERAVRMLREQYAQGALTPDELDERIGAALDAHASDVAPVASVTGNATASDLDTINRHLATDEWVEWAGHPDPTRRFTRGDRYLIPFSIVWGGFAIFWEVTAVSGGAGVFFALWGIPFVALGVYMIFGRFLYKSRRKRRTIYAVTNRRVMTIVRRRRGDAVEAMSLAAIPSISTSIEAGGRGTIFFGAGATERMYADSGLELFGRDGSTGGIGFLDVDDPNGLARLVEHLRACAHDPAAPAHRATGVTAAT